jgi:hypothetical protein
MKFFAMIESVNSLKEEHPTLMGFIPSKTVNRFDRSEQLEMRKPTVACRPSASMNFWHPTHSSRQQTSQPSNLKCRLPREREVLYD